jgi:hypothetical protein
MRLRVHWERSQSRVFPHEAAVAIGLLLTLITLSSCQPTTSSEAATKSTVETKTPSPSPVEAAPQKYREAWQRMRECAEQTDRIAKRAGWVEGKRTGDLTIMGWRNHYSPKYGRCFVIVSYMSHSAENAENQPPLFYELYDAFEARLLSICTDAISYSTSTFCSIPTGHAPSWDCAECRQFANDRMDH